MTLLLSPSGTAKCEANKGEGRPDVVDALCSKLHERELAATSAIVWPEYVIDTGNVAAR